MNCLHRLSLAAIVALSGGALCAAPVVDNSPDALGLTSLSGFTAGNTALGQNFLARFTLLSDAVIDGASIYSNCASVGCGGPSIGTAVVTKFRGDDGGAPGASNLFAINSLVTAIDSMGSSAEPAVQRIHTDFGSFTLAAGNYWIGISGDVSEIGWNLQFGTPSAGLWQLAGDLATGSLGDTAAAFQVDGAANPTPEPATLATVAAALVLMGGLRRRRNSAA